MSSTGAQRLAGKPACERAITVHACWLKLPVFSLLPRLCALPSYPAYQPGDGPRVAAPDARDWRAADADAAAMLRALGAGVAAAFQHTSELRARGLAWDSDPEDEE